MNKQINDGPSPDEPLGYSRNTAAPVGETIKTTIERGDAYLSPEIYNLQITVLEIIRGDKATELLKANDISVQEPEPGYVSIVVRIALDYSRKVRGLGDEPFTLTEGQFTAVSSISGQEYVIPRISHQPDPQLIDVSLAPGETREGYIVLRIAENDKGPYMIFKRQHVEGVYGIWSYVWFQLHQTSEIN